MNLSIIVPCHNESATLNEFYDMVTTFLKEEKMKYELIFVDDGSTDDSLNKLKLLKESDKNIKIISFSRNFGKESAMLAGLNEATGKYISIMDADLQQRIETLFEMYNKLIDNKDYDVVCAYRETREDESSIKRFFTSAFYRINNLISYVKLLPGASDFRIFKSEVKDAILSMPEKNRFLKGIFSWLGFNTIYVPYTPSKRIYGKSNWSFFKLFTYSINGIISFSTKPLKFVCVGSLIIFLISFINFLFMGNLSFRTIILFIGILMFNFSIVTLYLIRMYTNSLNRPIYVIKYKDVDSKK